MLRIEDLSLVFHPNTPLQKQVFQDFNLSIPHGQFVTLIGSNGAGKSSLLNAIAGEVQPQAGRLYVGERDISALATHQRAPWIARVFQDPMAGTCEHLSIEENLALAIKRGQKRHLSRALKYEYRQIFCERLASLGLGLEKRLQDLMGQLSGGQRQAVSLLMATLQPLDILLLDEHTAALDPKTAAFVLNLTAQIVKQQNLTVLMVTHSMRQALAVGDRTLMLHEGRLVFDVSGEQRKALEVKDLLALFSHNVGEELSDDALLLG